MTVPIPQGINQAGYGFSVVYPYGSTPQTPAWIVTDEQHNRLTALAREIAFANDLTLSVHIEKDSMTIGLYSIVESEEELAEETVEEKVLEDDPVERLAREVSQLNGYALGAFMQMLMKFGDQS